MCCVVFGEKILDQILWSGCDVLQDQERGERWFHTTVFVYGAWGHLRTILLCSLRYNTAPLRLCDLCLTTQSPKGPVQQVGIATAPRCSSHIPFSPEIPVYHEPEWGWIRAMPVVTQLGIPLTEGAYRWLGKQNLAHHMSFVHKVRLLHVTLRLMILQMIFHSRPSTFLCWTLLS